METNKRILAKGLLLDLIGPNYIGRIFGRPKWEANFICGNCRAQNLSPTDGVYPLAICKKCGTENLLILPKNY